MPTKVARTLRFLALSAAGVLAWTVPALAQVCPGSCNGDGRVTAGELTRMIAIVLNCEGNPAGCEALPVAGGCPAGDVDGNGKIEVNEIVAVIWNILRYDTGCPPPPATFTPLPPTETATPAPATETFTPVPPTETFTPVPPSATFTAVPPTETFTPVPPTETFTPVPPTATPTGVPALGTYDLDLLPGSGLCVGSCLGGTNDGGECSANGQCPGGACGRRFCVGGDRNGQLCSTITQCPGGTDCAGQAGTCFGGSRNKAACALDIECGNLCAQKACVGGANDKRACTSDTNCPNVCVGGTNAGLSCTSNTGCPGSTCGNVGTCRDQEINGNCAIVQIGPPLAAIRVALNGRLQIQVGAPNAEGIAPVFIPRSEVKFEPVVVSGIGSVCVGLASDASGEIDCDGGSEGLNPLLQVDHNTSPQVCLYGVNAGQPCTTNAQCGATVQDGLCNLANSGPGIGFPDDPTCEASRTAPNGIQTFACPEGKRICLGGELKGRSCLQDTNCPGSTCAGLRCRAGANAGQACSLDTDCPLSTCGAYVCRGGTEDGELCFADPDCPSGRCMPCNGVSGHTGVCNSPTQVTVSGTKRAGDMTVAFPQTLQILGSPTLFGPDGRACTADDAAPPPAAVTVLLTTGKTEAKVFDFANVKGNTVDATVTCGTGPCITTLTGRPYSCSELANGNFTGRLVGGFPALDTSSGDIITSFSLVPSKKEP